MLQLTLTRRAVAAVADRGGNSLSVERRKARAATFIGYRVAAAVADRGYNVSQPRPQ